MTMSVSDRTTLGDGGQVYSSLPKLVLAILCLLHSSAAAERTFTAVNNLKTKQRNRLAGITICSLLHTERMLGSSNCFEFKIDKEVLQLAKK